MDGGMLRPSSLILTSFEVDMRTKLLGTALAMLFFCGSLAWLPALGQDRPRDGQGGRGEEGRRATARADGAAAGAGSGRTTG